jgi:hypothetical protein
MRHLPMSYFSVVAWRAFNETKTFWDSRRLWLSLAAPASGILLQFFITDHFGGWLRTLLAALFALAFTMLGIYVINAALRVPSILYREQETVIAELKERVGALEDENRSLRQPRITPLQQVKLDLVTHKLKNCSSEARQTVYFLLLHGEVKWSEFRSMIAQGVPDSALHNRLAETKRLQLVQERFDQADQQGVWFVRPELREALEQYFAEEQASR